MYIRFDVFFPLPSLFAARAPQQVTFFSIYRYNRVRKNKLYNVDVYGCSSVKNYFICNNINWRALHEDMFR